MPNINAEDFLRMLNEDDSDEYKTVEDKEDVIEEEIKPKKRGKKKKDESEDKEDYNVKLNNTNIESAFVASDDDEEENEDKEDYGDLSATVNKIDVEPEKEVETKEEAEDDDDETPVIQLFDPMLNKETSFHGNPSLKGRQEVEGLSIEHLKELKRCSEDPIYFAEHYVYIVNIDTGKQLIKLFPYQKRMLDTYKNNRRTITLSCRQSGKCVSGSTMITIKSEKYTNNNPVKVRIEDFYNRFK